MAELSLWLSHVCEVITDPSAEAVRPTMIDVQPRASAAHKRPATPTSEANVQSRQFRMMCSSKGARGKGGRGNPGRDL